MRPVQVAQGLRSTALGLGCATLFRLPSRRERLRLLSQALDAGIVHFDTAPMYGLGMAEIELGRFARGRRDQLVIATKFGIAATRLTRTLGRWQGPARRLARALPAVQQQAQARGAGPRSGGLGALLYAPTGYGPRAARDSLEASLRRLGTDHVDLFLLHDPEPADIRSDEICEYLEDARQRGLVRAWGIAGEAQPTRAVATVLGEDRVPVLQTRADVLSRCAADPPPVAPGRVTFGVLAGPLAAIGAHLKDDRDRRAVWEARLGEDCAQPEVLAALLLREAMAANRDGVVLYSTTRSDHLRAAVSSAADVDRSAADVEAFRALIHEDLAVRGTEAPAL